MFLEHSVEFKVLLCESATVKKILCNETKNFWNFPGVELLKIVLSEEKNAQNAAKNNDIR